VPDVLSGDDIAERIAARQGAGSEITHPAPAVEQPRRRYRWVKPFSEAADGLIEYAQNPEGRFLLGLHDVDVMTRGFGRGELVYVTGRAHSGKTQVVLNGLNANPDKRIIFFTPDEVSELVLSKLVSIRHGIDAETLEQRIKDGDQYSIELVRKTATRDFPNLIVIDESLTLSQMHEAVREAEDWWGGKTDCVIIDFLELIPGDGEGEVGVVAKSQALKRWGKEIDAPVICLHQGKRSAGPRGQAQGMDGMRYGGDTEAIFVLEVFRKRDDEQMDPWERQRHENTVTVNVAKNKRPPCKKGERDFFMDPNCGLVRPWTATDMAVAGVPQTDAMATVRAAAQQMPGQTSVDDL
jgi:replicative DNA helicase